MCMFFFLWNIKYRRYTIEVCYGPIWNVRGYNKPSQEKKMTEISAASSSPLKLPSPMLIPVIYSITVLFRENRKMGKLNFQKSILKVILFCYLCECILSFVRVIHAHGKQMHRNA